MSAKIYRNSEEAWEAFRQIGGLETSNRDQDLVDLLRQNLNPSASHISEALSSASVEQFLTAFFSSVQPFVSMFKDILSFFEKLNVQGGQSRLRLSVGEEFLDYKHFEEFLESWNKLDVIVDVPVLDRRNAFLLNSIRQQSDYCDSISEGIWGEKPTITGIPDVDDWLKEYDADQYAPFPTSLMPEYFPEELAPAVALILAAVTIVRQRGMRRSEIIEEHRARNYESVEEDALHPWTIAQSETDYWLRSHIGYLANISKLSRQKQQELALSVHEQFSKFPRRRVPVTIQSKELERLLSLPAWKKRYETYGVWIATKVIDALNKHKVEVNGENGELKFAFAKTKIADIITSLPRQSLYSERRTPLSQPIGKGRKKAVQPDFSVWTEDDNDECRLVIEVKHYKKRSRRNFRDVLIDYSRAHPSADVLLVNYGPVGEDFYDLPEEVVDRCKMLGPLTPETQTALKDFQEFVRSSVGKPILTWQVSGMGPANELIALDVSLSMQTILGSSELRKFLTSLNVNRTEIAFIDREVRKIGKTNEFEEWYLNNKLGLSTSLSAPVRELISNYKQIVVITDDDGLRSLEDFNPEPIISPLGAGTNAIFVRITV